MAEPNLPECPLGAEKCPIFSEVEKLTREVIQLRQQVIRDPLTGLFNKRHLNDALATEMERSRRNRLATSLILLDIDHFKAINDHYGHVAGDRVLEALARVLEQAVRMIDIPCRYGGEEFAVILPSTPLVIACQVAERIRIAIANTQIALETETITVTASLGLSCFTDDQQSTPLKLTERADRELYQAKHCGRNRVHSEPWAETSTQLTEEEKAALFHRDDTSD